MKAIIFFTVFLFLFETQAVLSQNDEFSKWIGNWQTSYVNNINTKIDENLTISWAHLNRWLQFDITGGSKEYNFSSMMVLTLDNNFDIVGWYINEGGYTSMGTIKGVLEDGKLIIESKSQNWTSKSTWFIKDGKLHNKGKSKSLVTGETFSNEIIYTKKTDN